MSKPTSVSRVPSLARGLTVTVGSDISSATNGSSVAIVAGKKRSPANPCAAAGRANGKTNSAPSVAAEKRILIYIQLSITRNAGSLGPLLRLEGRFDQTSFQAMVGGPRES